MPKIASVAMKVAHDAQINRQTYLSYIEKAAKEGVELIVFPELSLQGFPPSMADYQAEAAVESYRTAELIPEGLTCQMMIEQAKKHQMYIVWGMGEQDHDRCDVLYNSAVLVGPEGFVGVYRKVHQPGTERLYSFPGDNYYVFDTTIGKIGIMICFDKMFPEVARILKVKGADVIICPTAWPAGTRSENDPSLKLYKMANEMRAIENNITIIDSNNVSEETPDGFECGHSRIVDPVGRTLATTGFDEGMAIADIDFKKSVVDCICTSMATMCNYMKDRRPDTYADVCK